MPLADRSLLMDCATATGSSPSPSRWLLISLGSVPAALTWASQVCHSLGFCSGSAASDGPTVSALGARLWISCTAVSHISKYWVVSMPGAQKIGLVRLVPDVVGDRDPGRLDRADHVVEEADPVRAVPAGARPRRVGRLAAVRAVDVAQDHLVLRVVRRLGEALGLRDHLGDVGLGARTVGVPVPDPAAGGRGVPAGPHRGDAERLQELVRRLRAVLAHPVEETLADAGRRPVT